MTRTRRDAWTLTDQEGDWPATLVAYERAVGLLRDLDPPNGPPVDPLGWQYLAAIHGRATAGGQTDTSDPLWSTCQHGSWYFLPWHRMYLLAFEHIVQHVLGDPDWSLPYWFSIDPDERRTAALPPAFREARPGNDLFTTERSAAMNQGDSIHDVNIFGIALEQAVIDALDTATFSSDTGIATFGGGERATPLFNGPERGLLEDVPHGFVHSFVGDDFDENGNQVGRGWMGSFVTAGLDPIFWLHHANIDRLWQVWLDHDPSRVLPVDDPAWFDTEFSFPAPGGGLQTWKVGDVLDTVALGYEYDRTTAPSGVAPPAVPPGDVDVGPGLGTREVGVPEPMPPQVLGATRDVPLASSAPVEVTLSEPADLALGGADVARPDRVFLRIEGITGTAAAPAYAVYLNVPGGEDPDDHPELRAGMLSTFGMAESSQRDDLHDGSGITSVLDITAVRDALEREGSWDPARIEVTFRPVLPRRTVPAEAEDADVREPDLRASQITVVSA
jgi:tyrosinase